MPGHDIPYIPTGADKQAADEKYKLKLEQEAADAKVTAAKKKETTANITDELAAINNSAGTTEERAAQIKEVAAKYAESDQLTQDQFNNILIANAAVNGTTPESLAYLTDNETAFGFNTGGFLASEAGTNIRISRAKEANPEAVAMAEAIKEDNTKDSDAAATVLSVDATKELSDQEAISLTRQTHQCILTHYLQPVADHHRGRMGSKFSKANVAPDDATSPAKIILVDDTSSDSSLTPINSLTSLGKTDTDDISPAQLAGLMPALRLYKVYREGGVEVAKVEYKFSNSTDRGFLTNASPSIATGDFVMDAGYAKGRSAGIKSFNWSFIGGDPFTATRDLKATLKLFFQDFRDLTEIRTDSKNLFANADSNAPNPEYKYLDLIVQPDCRESYYAKKKRESESTEDPPSQNEKSYDAFNPECYEVAVEVGYAETPSLPESLKNQTDTIYLTMVEHSFDIGQDGTFELTIEYRARLANLLGDKGMNILAPAGGHMVENSYNKQYLTFDIREVEELIQEEKQKSKDDESYESEDSEALTSVKNHLLHLRSTSLYRSMSNTLLRNELIYKMTVPFETFARFSNFDKFDRDKNKLVGLDVKNLWSPKKGDIITVGGKSGATSAAGEEGLELNIKYLSQQSAGKGIPGTGFLAGVGNLGGGGIGTADVSGRMSTSAEGVTFKEDIYFTTVGNLLAVALEHVIGEGSFVNQAAAGDIRKLTGIFKAAQGDQASDASKEKVEAITPPPGGIQTQGTAGAKTAPTQAVPVKINANQREVLERFRVILGAVTYIDALSGSEKTINLAHLPVSMQMFRQFMIDRVISQNKTFYSLQDFIKDILTDIVFDSLNRICFGGYTADDSSVRAGVSLFSGQGVKAGDVWAEPITSKTGTGIYEKRKGMTYKTLNTSVASRSNPIFTNAKTNKAKEFNYLMISANSSLALNSKLHGDKEEDADKGIAHFRYGSTAGMMKSISFSKSPIEYLAEERYVREGSDNLLNQLAGRYDMQMSMVGNNMFIPGQYVYFDPVALGIGKSYARTDSGRSLSNLMGLGGYHIITEVGCSITPGKYETTIKGLWETGGRPAKNKET